LKLEMSLVPHTMVKTGLLEVRRCVHYVLAEKGRRHWDKSDVSTALPYIER
jgi:hypothetical protein